MIVTSNDVGLEVKCNYNLSNKSVSHNADLEVDGQLPGEANAEQTIVQAPNVTMRITDRYLFLSYAQPHKSVIFLLLCEYGRYHPSQVSVRSLPTIHTSHQCA